MPKDLIGVDVVVYGHSHKYLAEVVDGVLWLNPGSCGKRRFHLEITMCRMTVDDGCYQFEKVVSAEPELKVEVTCLREKVDTTIEAVKKVHPYEEPVFNVIPLYRTSF